MHVFAPMSPSWLRGRALHRGLCVAFVLVSAAAGLAGLAPVGHRGVLYIGAHGLLSAVMFAAWWTSQSAAEADHRWTLVAGYLARLVLIASPAFVSHDVFRYLWDGRVAIAGFDPYRLVPSAPELEPLRALGLPPQEHPSVPTAYPPGAIGLFAAAALAGPGGFWAWKAIVVAASIAGLALGARMLRSAGAERNLPLLALSPLLVLEGGIGAHVDLVSTLCLTAAMAWSRTGRTGRAGLAIGIGTLIKLLPAAAAVPMALAVPRRGRWRVLAATAGTVALGYTLAVVAGLRPVGGLFAFFAQWRFGSPIFAAADGLLGETAAVWVCAAIAVVGMAVSCALALRGAHATAVMLALAAPLLASPVVHPWYLTAIVPAVALTPSGPALAWLTALPLSYELVDRFDRTGRWEPAMWPLAAVAAAWLIGAAFAAWLRRVRGGGG